MVGIGDTYLEKNKKGQIVLCIGIGGGKVSKSVIHKRKPLPIISFPKTIKKGTKK